MVGDLYRPRTATRRHRVPAILATNGFGGSKADQAGLGKMFARRGYVFLSYSGLGFGGSTCKITLDDRAHDGAAGSQLLSYLGGKANIAYLDAQHTRPAPRLRVVTRDRRDHRGQRRAHDPRVGMIGGSYGGQVQFAVAAVDARLDTIVPMITWNDLSYSLGSNTTSQSTGVTTSTPGTTKLSWGLGFSGIGVIQGVQGAPDDPQRLFGCPNFATWVCPALVTGGTLGYFDSGTQRRMLAASVASYHRKVRIPTLLVQGQDDTLFDLNEATATYRALRRQGTPVRMIWQRGGHSGGAAPGEWDAARPSPRKHYVVRRAAQWFDRYLKGRPTDRGPRFAYYRDWVRYTGNAAPAYAGSDRLSVGKPRAWHLSGRDSLVRSSSSVRPGSAAMVTPAAGAPTSIDPLDVVGSFLPQELPETEVPGASASWTSAPLTRSQRVVGAPEVRLKVSAPSAALTQGTGPGGKLVLFIKLRDVDASGRARLVHGLIAPVRVPDVNRSFTVTLPAIVHRFAKGHRIRLTVAGGSPNYRGGLGSHPVTITSGAGQRLLLPTL